MKKPPAMTYKAINTSAEAKGQTIHGQQQAKLSKPQPNFSNQVTAGLHPSIPRGVYRFKTHEEANEWMDKMLARNQKPKA